MPLDRTGGAQVDRIGFLKANLCFALTREDLREETRRILEESLAEASGTDAKPSAKRATESRWLVAVPSAALPERTCQGDLVIWGNRSDVVGVVLLVGSTEAFVYVPGIFTVSTQEGPDDGRGSAR